jgi:hypothetical protein
MKYDVDDETRELLEAALNMLAQVAEMQYTDEGLAGVYSLANTLADTFGIESRVATVTEEDGVIHVTYTEEDDDTPPDTEGTVH